MKKHSVTRIVLLNDNFFRSKSGLSEKLMIKFWNEKKCLLMIFFYKDLRATGHKNYKYWYLLKICFKFKKKHTYVVMKSESKVKDIPVVQSGIISKTKLFWFKRLRESTIKLFLLQESSKQFQVYWCLPGAGVPILHTGKKKSFSILIPLHLKTFIQN